MIRFLKSTTSSVRSALLGTAILGSAVATVVCVDQNAIAAEPTLTIGSPAPALDIEHYLQDGNGKFGPVTKFEEGKVYVVEFWATWCGPCIQSMPHLAQLQEQYRDKDVQIISVSDEDLETVEGIMSRDYPGKDDMTFAELTAAYTLTVDPDGSVTEDYMRAANQNGIPASFLVGKTGIIEWIGHPMSLDEPLEQVVEGTWDREAFKEQMARQQRLEVAMEKVNRLAGSGQFQDAIKVIDKVLEDLEGSDDEMAVSVREQLVNFKYNLRLDSGDLSEEVLAFFRKNLAEAKGNPQKMAQYSFGLMSSMQQGTDVGPLAGEVLTALGKEIDGADKEMKPILYYFTANMNAALSKFDAAIEAQTQAVELSTGNQKERMQEMLKQLQALAKQAAEEAASSEDKQPAKK